MSIDHGEPSVLIDHGGLCRVEMSPDGTVEMAQFCTMYAVKTDEGYELKFSVFIGEKNRNMRFSDNIQIRPASWTRLGRPSLNSPAPRESRNS